LIISDFSYASISSNTIVQSFIRAVLKQTILTNVIVQYESLVFNNDTNDIAVPISSEKGGISGNSVSYYPFIWHIGSPDQINYKNDVASLLNSDPNSSLFTMNGFSPPNLRYIPPAIPPIQNS